MDDVVVVSTLFISTLRAIAAPRRLIPVALVTGGLVLVELATGIAPVGALHALVMCSAFVLFAPTSWRVLFSGDAPRAPLDTAWRLAVYAATGALVVGVLGWLLPFSVAMRSTLLTDAAGLPVTLVLFWVGGWGLGRDVDLELSLERARAHRDHAQLLAVRAHLDPHFLFNTLNAIAEWCREDPAEAERATLRLAAMLRLMLEGITEDRWPLERELDLVRDLWALHHARDPERFSAEVSVDAPIQRASVPPLLLLPLAENAMTHGVWRGGRGAVLLRATRDDDQVCVVIDSPGAYGGPRERGHGLSTVRERLALAFGPRGALDIGPTPDDEARTRVALSFPFLAEPTLENP